MPRLRRDATTGDWIAFAPGRGSRPHDRAPAAAVPPSGTPPSCPFCPGNEDRTPPVILQRGEGRGRIRVVPNRFPAFGTSTDARRDPPSEADLFEEIPSEGAHEVVIETDSHEVRFSEFSADHVAHVFEVHQERHRELRKLSGVHSIVSFRNYRPDAGASLGHPHSQIMALPLVTPDASRRLEAARRHYQQHGTTLLADLRDAERRARTRILFEEGSVVALHPFASRHPFETWILPLGNDTPFEDATKAELRALAVATRRALTAIAAALDDPPFNFVIHTPPVADERRVPFLWHVQILPRLTPLAGFELGTGMFINGRLPEDTAGQIRRTIASVEPQAREGDPT